MIPSVISATVLHGGPHTLGLLMTASGLGSNVATTAAVAGLVPPQMVADDLYRATGFG